MVNDTRKMGGGHDKIDWLDAVVQIPGILIEAEREAISVRVEYARD